MCQTNFRFNFRTAAHQSRRFAKPLYASPPPPRVHSCRSVISSNPSQRRPLHLSSSFRRFPRLPLGCPFPVGFRFVLLSRLWSYRCLIKDFTKFAIHTPCSLFRNRLHPQISCPVSRTATTNFRKMVGFRHYDPHSPDPPLIASRRSTSIAGVGFTGRALSLPHPPTPI